MSYFDRYSPFRNDGKIEIVPFIEIEKKSSDKYITFKKDSMRLDKISYEYYKSPDYVWLILQANPEYGSIENFIPDGVTLRIPYPLDITIGNYLNDIKLYKEMNI